MAGTLLPAPTLGASDWSSWITLVDAVRRGYLAASYTNFAASAESALASGSLVEVAGAVYSFTQTAIDYTGAGSTNSDLYIYVKPDAVVSTATVVAWGSAPVWVSAKQGFYASAASTARAIGGMFVGSAATYANKYVYGDESVDYCLRMGKTRPLLKATFEIGEWNMDATGTKIVTTSYIYTPRVRMIDGVIRDDLNNWVSFYYDNLLRGSVDTLIWSVQGSYDITLERAAGGVFDSSSYDGTASTVANRGYVYIEYEA